jgi:hypothetical protein
MDFSLKWEFSDILKVKASEICSRKLQKTKVVN